MNSDFADAGDLALDADNLAVRLVRVDAPFADEFAARRESANLERALVERVQLFQETAFYTKGEVVASTATAPRHTLVRPVASDLLAVVTDERHAQIVGLFLKADKPNAWSVFDTGGSSQAARDVLRAVLPKAMDAQLCVSGDDSGEKNEDADAAAAAAAAVFNVQTTSPSVIWQRAAELGDTAATHIFVFPLVGTTHESPNSVPVTEFDYLDDEFGSGPPAREKETPSNASAQTPKAPPRKIAIQAYAKPTGGVPLGFASAADGGAGDALGDAADGGDAKSSVDSFADAEKDLSSKDPTLVTPPAPVAKTRVMTFSNFAPAATPVAKPAAKPAKAAKAAKTVSKTVSFADDVPVASTSQNPKGVAQTQTAPARRVCEAETAEAERAVQAELLASLESHVSCDAIQQPCETQNRNVKEDGRTVAVDLVVDPVTGTVTVTLAVARADRVESPDASSSARFAADAVAMPPPPPVSTTYGVKSVPPVTLVSPPSSLTTLAQPSTSNLPSRVELTATTKPTVAPPAAAPPPAKKAKAPRKKQGPAFSGYLTFNKLMRPTLASGMNAMDQGKELGVMWKAAAQDVKDRCVADAATAKAAYLAGEAEKAKQAVLETPATPMDADPSMETTETSTMGTSVAQTLATKPAAVLSPAAAAANLARKEKRKAASDPTAADLFLRKRFKAAGGNAIATEAFLKSKEAPTETLVAFLRKHKVPTSVGKKAMKKNELVENALRILTATATPTASKEE